MSLPSFKMVEKVSPDSDELIKELGRVIERTAAEAIKERGVFTIGLSGGSMIMYVRTALPNITTDWSAWRLLLCDERLVPLSSPDSTLQSYLEDLLLVTPLKREQFVEVDTEMEPEAAAAAYEQKLRALFPPPCPALPTFDLLLLGVGYDGHTASLFPGHPLLTRDDCWVASITDSPKPPPERVTLTLPAINAARRCVFVMSTKSKNEIVETLRGQLLQPATEGMLPAALVRPTAGELLWLLDASAAGLEQ